MTLRLYNTMSRQVEAFVPLAPGRVSLYTCGPTIWNFAHIGNFRTFLFEDLLRRWLEASGLTVFHVMNLTDVDDRTIQAAARAGVSLREHVEPYAQAFFADRDYLRIRPAHAYPRATQFIAPMISLVESLLAKGVAYRGDDGSVYFAIGKFPEYGRLSQLDRRELRSGASGRVSSDEYAKEDARDFVLWKAAQPDDEAVGAAWDAPFGRGRPGWHLECSAMALDLLRQKWGEEVLDIHCGGVDLIFPHHEDEIAQSCAHTGQAEFARVWMHAEFLNIRGAKMSKRFGNITTARDLMEDGVDAAALRLFFFQTHYRQKLDLNDESLGAAATALRRLGDFAARLAAAPEAAGGAVAAGASADLEGAATRLREQFAAALDDDLNAPRAVAALFDFVTAGNRALDRGAVASAGARGALDWATGVLDVLPTARAADAGLAAWVEERIQARRAARQARNFAEADAIRDELAARGVTLEDGQGGTKWRVG
ncbi:MAG TPA: cysteine--tRNA ligase [Gemmatimonadales bacterium]|nr:cysteine--tRNA ligase [Gemmatimonadales bacterium]